jgi:hypothetical protein
MGVREEDRAAEELEEQLTFGLAANSSTARRGSCAQVCSRKGWRASRWLVWMGNRDLSSKNRGSDDKLMTKQLREIWLLTCVFSGSGGRIRTCDLRVMSRSRVTRAGVLDFGPVDSQRG